jgi:hypothetical protein
MTITAASIFAIASVLLLQSASHAFPIQETQSFGWNPTTLHGNIASQQAFFDDMNPRGPEDLNINGERRATYFYLTEEQDLLERLVESKPDDYTECLVKKRKEGDLVCLVMNADRRSGDEGTHRHFCWERSEASRKYERCVPGPTEGFFYAEELGKEPRDLEKIFRYFVEGGYHYENNDRTVA